MVDKVKLALRVSGDAFDDEVCDLVETACADLRLVGVIVPEIGGLPTSGDPLIDRAITFYAKAHFGFNEDSERYEKAYEHLKCALSLSGNHTEV